MVYSVESIILKKNAIFVYELNTSDLYIAMEVYPYETAFSNSYCRECTKEEYNRALNYILGHIKE